ncbi:MAG: hypothetical protein ACHQAY_25675 [Hyphomicrobiales bacterium]
MSDCYRRYVFVLGAILAGALLPILVLNLMLGRQAFEPRNVLLASDWQQRTHGITSASPDGISNRAFKALRVDDRLPEINALVFGSSTAMGITADMFPAEVHIYNFAQNMNFLPSVVSEVDYMLDHQPHLDWMFVPLDWSIGSLFQRDQPPVTDLSAERQRKELLEASDPPYDADMLQDALAYPRVVNLMQILGRVAASSAPLSMFRSEFLQNGGDEYVCADGLAKDFELYHRGRCEGFAFDGSKRFRDMERIVAARPRIAEALAAGSLYRARLLASHGRPTQELLDRLARASARLRRRGGHMVFFLPPLLPGLEAAFLRDSELGPLLTGTKDALDMWEKKNDLEAFDAGQSERFNCRPEDFVDQHHATPDCYRKIFAAYFADRPGIASRR